MQRPGPSRQNMNQRTKIVATMGPALQKDSTLKAAIRAGLNAARINFAHGQPDEHLATIRRVRKAAKETGKAVAVLVDLGGPKIRIRGLPTGRLQLTPGGTVDLVLAGDAQKGEIPVNERRLIQDVGKGDPIFLADGSFELRALKRETDRITCRVVTGGLLIEGKGVNVPHTRLKLPALTNKDRRDLKNAIEWSADLVALSFVRNAKDLRPARRLLGTSGIPLLAKIEKAEAITQLDAIVRDADGVMVARGDLGVETSLVEIPLLQKRIIATANKASKPVITATQMLRSMVENPHPTRAEATDVANAILDGTDAVMLSEETAVGKHPVKAIATMAAIARAAETALLPRPHGPGDRDALISGAALAVSHAAVELAESVGAVAIVTPTRSGATARNVARLRPRIPVLALSHDATTVAKLLITWGVTPTWVPHRDRLESIIEEAGRQLRIHRLGRPGDAFLLTAGYPSGTGDSNLLTVQRVASARKTQAKQR
jgi:pyruvate kinase